MIQIQLLITKVIGKMYKSTKVKVTQIFSARIYIDLVICDAPMSTWNTCSLQLLLAIVERRVDRRMGVTV